MNAAVDHGAAKRDRKFFQKLTDIEHLHSARFSHSGITAVPRSEAIETDLIPYDIYELIRTLCDSGIASRVMDGRGSDVDVLTAVGALRGISEIRRVVDHD